MSRALSFAVAFAAVCAMTSASAVAADIAVLTTGAPSKVVQAVANGFAAQTGHRLTLVQDTAGGVRRRVEAGEQAAREGRALAHGNHDFAIANGGNNRIFRTEAVMEEAHIHATCQ